MQMQSAWRTLLEGIELMPKGQDFGFQPLRLKAVVQTYGRRGRQLRSSIAIMF
jgi:hypothetical protein